MYLIPSAQTCKRETTADAGEKAVRAPAAGLVCREGRWGRSQETTESTTGLAAAETVL